MYPMLSSVDSRTLVVLFGSASLRLISDRLLRGPESFSSSRIAGARRTEFDCDPTLSQGRPLTTGGKARCTCSNDMGNLHPEPAWYHKRVTVCMRYHRPASRAGL